MANPLWSSAQTILQSVLAIYAILLIAFYTLSDSVIFQPPTPTYKDNNKIIKIPVDKGQEISAIFLKHPQPRATLLFSHGNAEDLGTLYPTLTLYYQQGYSILAYDYQGYGTSSGKPSEKNTYQDITAAYQYLTQKEGIPANSIIVYGRSVGTGPSVYLAKNQPIKALILQSPFISAYRVQTRINLFPFDKYPNLKTLSTLSIPLLLIHGTNDRVIPIWHSKTIAKHYKGPLQIFWIKDANHNDNILISAKYWQTLTDFIHFVDKAQKHHNHE